MKKFFVFYVIAIAIALFAILFLVPEDFFLKSDIELPSNDEVEETIEFVDYEVQIDNLKKENYSFEYVILDSMRSRTYSYKCTGTKTGELETGTCSGTNSFTYTEEDKQENFIIDTDYLDIEKIFNLLEDTQPELTSYNEEREYLYNTQIVDKIKNNNIDTEIIIYTNIDAITKIEISNAYMTYILKYQRIA